MSVVLTESAIATALATLPGWTVVDAGLERTFSLPDYYRVMALVNAIAYCAHRTDHHPDLGVFYNRVHVRFTTHDAGGITALDLDGARAVEALAA